MIGFFLYLATVYHIPHSLYLLPFLILFVVNINKIDFSLKKIKTNYLIIFIIVGLSLLNILLSKNSEIIDFIPYTILMIPGFFIAQFVKKIDLKIIVILILFEALVSIVEYILGISTIFYKSDFYTKYASGEFFYFTRTFGLSSNSSVVSLKLFLAILIIDYFKLFEKHKMLIITGLLFGILFSFSRTIIIVLTFYYGIKLIAFLIKIIDNPNRKFKLSEYYYFATLIVFVLCVMVSINLSKHSIFDQITRGKEHVELSGREVIWPQFITKIKSDFIFGNHSKKYLADYHGEKSVSHAHNSFLQVLANNGIIIFILFMLLLIININKHNSLYILSLTLYSITQYGFFWGISLTDIILFLFFIYNNKQSKESMV